MWKAAGPLVLVLVALSLSAATGCGEDTAVGANRGDVPIVDDDADDAIGRVDVEPGCVDNDGDGYGDGCVQGLDCDDRSRNIHPGVDEQCDGVDNNCDDFVDEECPCTEGAVQVCYTGPGGSEQVGRCRAGFQYCADETWGACEGQIVPVEEACDRVDNDCDGEIDEELVNACGRCAPPPSEICGDRFDNDCDGTIDESEAGCDCDDRTAQPCYSGPPTTLGVGTCQGGRFDCVGEDWGPCRGEVLPAEEVCDGVDNDCDGFVDEGLTNACGTCGAPTPEEVCDGSDNDCDGLVDEGLLLVCGLCAGGDFEEVCGDGFDGDCDGLVDEGCGCDGPNDCYPGPPARAGVGACTMGRRTCQGGEFWSECTGYVLPRPEVCDGVDNDCDGLIDISPLGCDLCQANVETCDNVDNDCDGLVDELLRNSCGDCIADVEPEEECGPECCDGFDDDCDGLVDEGLINACGTCGDSCYVDRNTPSEDDDIGEGGELVDPDDEDNPTGRAGITLSSDSVIPPYLWVANHTHDTVSRFNTETLQEEGRYWVGDNPSRTGVDLDGNVWIGGRDDGRLTKILWDTTACPDRNGSGAIDTVSADNLGPINSAGDPLADECVVYSAVPNPSRASIRGSAPGPDGTVWIGYSGGGIGSIDPHTLELGPFVAATGAPLFAPDGDGFQQPVMSGDTQQTGNTGGVYGLVVDSRGHLYTSSYNRNTLARFDTNTGQWIALYTELRCGSYGIAIDAENRVWIGGWPGCRGIGMFDPATDRIHNFAIPTTTTMAHGVTSGVDPSPAAGCGSPNYCVTGVGAEPATGDIWASFYAVGYTGRLRVNADNYAASQWTFIGTTRDADGNYLPGVDGPDLRGVGFDLNGFAWTHGLGSNRIWMIDPATNERATALPDGYPVGVGTHYTYSDFTGSTALSFTSPRSNWSFQFDSGYANAQPDRVVWEAYVPPLTTAGIRVRTLDSAGDPTSEWVPAPLGDGTPVYESYPEGADQSTFDLTSEGLVGQLFEVEVRLTTSDAEVKPIVHTVDIYWQRP